MAQCHPGVTVVALGSRDAVGRAAGDFDPGLDPRAEGLAPVVDLDAIATLLEDGAADTLVTSLPHGAWRSLATPGTVLPVATGATPHGSWRVQIGRTGWRTLLIRATASFSSGVRGVRASADSRSVVPLVPPLDVPRSAVTGGVPWTVSTGAVIDLTAGSTAETICRAGELASAAGVGVAPDLSGLTLPSVDPDTVTDSLVGAFRLTKSALSTPLQVSGLVVVDTDLSVGADFGLRGLLVTRGSVHPAGGRIDVIGAVVAGDAGGGSSTLGPLDRVRYDACAIRHAVEQVTHPAPGAAWSTLRLF